MFAAILAIVSLWILFIGWISGGVFLYPVGIVLLLVSAAVVLRGHLRRHLDAELRRIGVPVAAVITKVLKRTSTSVNGRHPYFVECQAVAPPYGRRTFRSRAIWGVGNLWALDGQGVTVYVDPRRPKRYVVDLPSAGIDAGAALQSWGPVYLLGGIYAVTAIVMMLFHFYSDELYAWLGLPPDAAGTFVSDGGRLKSWTMTADRCVSGEREGFFGVIALSKADPQLGVAVVQDPAQGLLIKADIPSEPRQFVFRGDDCKVLSGGFRRTNTRVNGIWKVRGSVELDCAVDGSHLTGKAEFDSCY